MASNPTPKLKILIHESSVQEDEMMRYLKKIPAEYTYVSRLPFTTDNVIAVNEKNGYQIDDIKATVRMADIYPSKHQDYAIYGVEKCTRAHELSIKYPDTRFFVTIGIGESSEDFGIEQTKNFKFATWQYIQDHLFDKLGIKKKEPKSEKKSQGKNTRSSVGKSPKVDTQRARPTEVIDEPEPYAYDQDYPEEEGQ